MDQSDHIVETLKKILRSRGKTYKDLATPLNLSEAGLKKSFAAGTLTLKRIEEICLHAGVSLSELFRLSEQHWHTATPTFSSEQENSLVEDERLFVIFYLIVAGITRTDILDRYAFDDNQLSILIHKLEKMELVTTTARGEVFPTHQQIPVWIRHGKLEKKYADQISKEFILEAENDTCYMKFLFGRFSKASYQILIEKMKELEIEFSRHSRRGSRDDDKTAEAADLALFHSIRPFKFTILQKYKKK